MKRLYLKISLGTNQTRSMTTKRKKARHQSGSITLSFQLTSWTVTKVAERSTPWRPTIQTQASAGCPAVAKAAHPLIITILRAFWITRENPAQHLIILSIAPLIQPFKITYSHSSRGLLRISIVAIIKLMLYCSQSLAWSPFSATWATKSRATHLRSQMWTPLRPPSLPCSRERAASARRPRLAATSASTRWIWGALRTICSCQIGSRRHNRVYQGSIRERSRITPIIMKSE